MTARVITTLRLILASGILATLSLFTASSLSFFFWLLFLLVFTVSILVFTRILEMWTVIPPFIAGKVWVYALGTAFNGYAILILSVSFIFLFFTELRRGYIQKSQIQKVECK